MSQCVVIVGSGVIGLSSAFSAARRGHHVTVIERQPEQRDGCSFGNAAMIVPSHFIPLAAPGMAARRASWMSWRNAASSGRAKAPNRATS